MNGMRIIIEGAGQIGSHLAKMLSIEGGEITVIDDDEKRLRALSSTADVVTILGDPTSIKVLRNAGVDKADLFIAVTPFKSQTVNIVSAQLAKRLGAKKVIARIDDEELLLHQNKEIFRDMGLDLMFYPEKIASDEIIEMIRRSSSTEFLDFAHGKLLLSVYKLDDDAPLLDMSVAEFSEAVADTNAYNKFRIIAISRRGETIIPGKDTRFKFMDQVYIIATKEGMPELMKFLGKEDMEIRSVMILGGSEVGEMTAAQLALIEAREKRIRAIKLIDKNPERCKQLSVDLPDEVDVAVGDIRNSDFLLDENIREYDAVVACAGNDEANIFACIVAKKFGVGRVIAQVENLEYLRLAEEMGVDAVINKKLLTAGRILKFTLSDKVRFVRYMSGTNAEVLEYTASPGSRATKGLLRDLDFPSGAIIGGIIRGSESFIAVGDTHIEPYDRVAVFALPESVKDVERFFK